MEWVIDSSVALTWCFRDERTAQSDALLDRLRVSPVIVPQHWRLELSNVLAMASRKARLTKEDRDEFVDLLDAMAIYVDTETDHLAFGPVLRLAMDRNLTTYDAAYLELAQRFNVPLATLDADLQAAAKSLRVPLL
jgi:predicted nucleic acid-binding protein